MSLLVELGMEDEARAELSRIVEEGLDQFRESLWLASLTYLTDACAALGDARWPRWSTPSSSRSRART